MEIPLEVPETQTHLGESPKREGVNDEVVKQSPSRSPSNSPEPQCSICLGSLRNKSFTDSCFHQFCFDCLQKWSKIRPVCPLCKHQFKSIIHNVRSDNDFDQYDIPAPEPDPWPDLQQLGHRFSYRTNVTPESMRALAIHRILLHSRMDGILPRSLFTSPDLPHRRGSSDFRLRVYMDNLWAQISPDITGRYRECSPQFYRENPATMHRLVPWLNRELTVLLENVEQSITYIIELIMELLTRYNIQSEEMEVQLRTYLGYNTVHFLHEFYNFARSPYDLQGYDLHATYNARPPLVIPQSSSSEIVLTDNQADNDVILIESSPEVVERLSPIPGPSSRFTSASSSITTDSARIFNLKEEDSDSDSCEVLAVLKPKHERTPVIVTLSESEGENKQRKTSVTAENGWSTDSEIVLSDSPSSSKCGSSSKRKKKFSSDSEWETPCRKKKKKSKKSSSRKSSKSKRRSKHRHWKKSLRRFFVQTISSSSNDSNPPATTSSQPSTSRGKGVTKYKPKIDRSKFRKSTENREVTSPPATRTSERIMSLNNRQQLFDAIGLRPSTSGTGDIQRARLERRCKTYASAALEHSPVLDFVLSEEEANDSSDSESGSFGWRSQPVRDSGLKLVLSNNKGNSRRDTSSDSSEEEEKEKSPPRKVRYKRQRCSSKKYISSTDSDESD